MADFQDKYGPWAVIIGASHGTGAESARQLAAQGLNCALVARSAPALLALKKELKTRYRVEARVITADLSTEAGVHHVQDSLVDLDLGLMVFNAGAPAYPSKFLNAPLQTWQDLLNLGANALMTLTYSIGQQLRERGKGGILLMGSHAGLGGNKKFAMYTATKGFMLNFGESLWMELKDQGIDVLNFLIQVVDTPTLRKEMQRAGIEGCDSDTIPGVYPAEAIVKLALRELPNGPTFIHPEDEEQGAGTGKARGSAVKERWEHTAPFVGED
ncbi:SDR family NAD(P)-dependent oxidoreductase [Aestuariicella hydrocarbonica]|uniref:SDR family NAD(P)-dependent oxidoreductase n=2 Tax=Pseudomaricurvus hydrocarbonicus TaxID=1470433 RepID=A0A9E5MLA6_9GAMM|nr:SDR family NAD(P)-dependent oxidoreductase [Aestuariicella hydrocarbonica]